MYYKDSLSVLPEEGILPVDVRFELLVKIIGNMYYFEHKSRGAKDFMDGYIYKAFEENKKSSNLMWAAIAEYISSGISMYNNNMYERRAKYAAWDYLGKVYDIQVNGKTTHDTRFFNKDMLSYLSERMNNGIMVDDIMTYYLTNGLEYTYVRKNKRYILVANDYISQLKPYFPEGEYNIIVELLNSRYGVLEVLDMNLHKIAQFLSYAEFSVQDNKHENTSKQMQGLIITARSSTESLQNTLNNFRKVLDNSRVVKDYKNIIPYAEIFDNYEDK
jgi:hypothetical protein